MVDERSKRPRGAPGGPKPGDAAADPREALRARLAAAARVVEAEGVSGPSAPLRPGPPAHGPSSSPPPSGPPPPPSSWSSPVPPAGPPKRSTGRGALWFLLRFGIPVLLLVAGGAVWAIFAGTADDRAINNAQVGDCLNISDSHKQELKDDREFKVATYDPRDCDKPHDFEVLGVATYPASGSDDYPGEDVAAEYGEGECLGLFEAYVGLPYEESELDVVTIYPTDGTWDAGDRKIVCLAEGLVGKLTQPVMGSRR